MDRSEMDKWFANAKVVERDALSALQLLYRFQGDNLGNQWWIHLQSLGFKHNGTTYELPKAAPMHCREKSYTAAELYQEMDRFAVPQLTSPYQEFPPCIPRLESLVGEERESQDFWQSMRDILIFKRFGAQTEGFQFTPVSVGTTTSASNTLNSVTNKRKTYSKDAGAELFMNKTKKGKKRGNMAGHDFSSSKVRFPSIRECVRDTSDCFDLAQVENNESLLAEDFPEWKFQAVMNHSLLCYGTGSKRRLLNMFADQLEEDGESVMVIDGFHKDVTIEGILDLISTVWLRDGMRTYNRYDVHAGCHLPVRPFGTCNYPSDGDANVVQRACRISRALARHVNEKYRGYYLILHGIDGVGLRNATSQEALASLVSFSSTVRGLNAFRLVASVDHVNGPALLWDSSTCAQFSWIWKALHTHRPYVEELLYGTYTDEKAARVVPRHRKDIDDPLEHKAIFTVLASLAPRHTEALQQLAGLQANQMADDRRKSKGGPSPRSLSSSWVPYKTLFKQCQRKCVVHGDEQLRRFLQELKDHGVVEQNSGDDADVLSYRIPHALQTLKDILEFSHSS
jgi:origin recognition complex subunit 2